MASRSEWTTVFERFPTGRVPIVGPVGIFLHDWAKPADGHPRLFDHRALEILTTAQPSLVASVYVPSAVALLLASVHAGGNGRIAGFAAAGVAVWSLTEYLIHRYAFHFVPRTRLGVVLAYLSHGVHHAYPHDPDRLVLPLIVSAPIASLLFVAGYATAGSRAFPFLAGFALGYLAYDLIHHRIHHTEADRGVFKWLRRYHFQHHFAAPDRQFGVSSPIWDYVFRTGR